MKFVAWRLCSWASLALLLAGVHGVAVPRAVPGTAAAVAVNVSDEFSSNVTKSSNISAALSKVGIEPGATTAASCARLKTLKDKFVMQLKNENKNFVAKSEEYTTKLCDDLGCEQDPAKREHYEGEWHLIEAAHQKEVARLTGLLDDIEEIIESVPFRRCPEFEDYLAAKAQNARGQGLIDGV